MSDIEQRAEKMQEEHTPVGRVLSLARLLAELAIESGLNSKGCDTAFRIAGHLVECHRDEEYRKKERVLG